MSLFSFIQKVIKVKTIVDLPAPNFKLYKSRRVSQMVLTLLYIEMQKYTYCFRNRRQGLYYICSDHVSNGALLSR